MKRSFIPDIRSIVARGVFDITGDRVYKVRMQPRVLWAVALCGVCLASRSDQLVGAEYPALIRALEVEPSTPPDPSQGVVYICPMDPDVRSYKDGICRRCGMNLVAGLPDPVEFHLDTRVLPPSPQVRQLAVLQFFVHDPWKDRPVSTFNVVHERFFHAFVVSEDLEFFEHGHPRLVADGLFQYPITFPKSGMFRVLSDYYPVGATPQLTTETVFVPGDSPAPPRLGRDYAPKAGTNMHVSLVTIPEQPTSGNRTQMRFTLDDARGLQTYLGAWGHMLAASEDLIDMMHEHPYRTDGAEIEFEVVFPRAHTYRVWVQFQRDGVVNTVHFDVPVRTLE
jgi:hypothetical protein